MCWSFSCCAGRDGCNSGAGLCLYQQEGSPLRYVPKTIGTRYFTTQALRTFLREIILSRGVWGGVVSSIAQVMKCSSQGSVKGV